MPSRKSHTRGRDDITQTVEQRNREYDKNTDALERDTEDFRVECEAIDGMEGVGTEEGMEAVTGSLHEARETTEQEFSDDGETLEQAESEGQEFEGELNERTEGNESDLERLCGAREELHSEAATGRVQEAEAQTREDIEFLQSEERRAREAREAAAQQYEQLKQIVHGTGG